MNIKHLKSSLIFALSLLIFTSFALVSCGEFVGYKDNEVDIGSISEVYITMPQEKMYRLYNSVTDNIYTSCYIDKDGWRGEASIKVRGDTSRRWPKKSFGLKINDKKYMLERGQENGGLYNRIVMRAYQLAGIPACKTESVGLFLNDSYLGCYNFITYYYEDILGGELYKCVFSDYDQMGNNHPLASKTDKEFPDDNDFSNLENLVAALTTFSDAAWRQYVVKNVNIDQVASYLAVHDFFTVKETHGANYYIYYDGKFHIYPWDNEVCMLEKSANYHLCNDNELIRRLASVPEVKNAYNQKMHSFFLGSGGGGELLYTGHSQERGWHHV